MKTRLSFVSILAVLADLAMVWSAAAQGADSKNRLPFTLQSAPARETPDRAEGARAAGFVPTSSGLPNTIYLPLVFSSYISPCSLPPQLISPANGATLDTLTPTFVYMNGTTPTTHAVIAFANNPDFSGENTYWSGGSYIGPNNITVFWNLEPATTYYWHVYNLCGAMQSPRSETFTFITGSGGEVLPAPNLVSPADGTTGVGSSTTLAWDAVAGAEGYQLFLCKQGSGCYLYFLPATPSSKLVSSLTPSTAYYWNILAYNHYAYGVESSTWYFTTGAFTAPQEGSGLAGMEGGKLFFKPANGPGVELIN